MLKRKIQTMIQFKWIGSWSRLCRRCLEHRIERSRLQCGDLIDREMVDAFLTAQIDIGKRAGKSGARTDFELLGEIDRRSDVCRHLVRRRAVEQDYQRDGNSLAIQRLRHCNYRIGAERMADEDNRAAIARLIGARDLPEENLGIGVVGHRCGNPVGLDFCAKIVDAK